jgi:SAM-dependent methyltransferase
MRTDHFPFARRIALVGFLSLFGYVAVANSDEKDREKWDARYAGDEFALGKSPVGFLRDNVDLLPTGKALDLAMGEGRNGVFLATKGFQVLGLDISEVGLRKAHRLAAELNTEIKTETVDLDQVELPASEFDVVLMTYYLQRDLFPQIKRALKPGGVVVVETYHEGHLKQRPTFPKEYLLDKHELLEVFGDFEILVYQHRDDGRLAVASIVARKPTVDDHRPK